MQRIMFAIVLLLGCSSAWADEEEKRILGPRGLEPGQSIEEVVDQLEETPFVWFEEMGNSIEADHNLPINEDVEAFMSFPEHGRSSILHCFFEDDKLVRIIHKYQVNTREERTRDIYIRLRRRFDHRFGKPDDSAINEAAQGVEYNTDAEDDEWTVQMYFVKRDPAWIYLIYGQHKD